MTYQVGIAEEQVNKALQSGSIQDLHVLLEEGTAGDIADLMGRFDLKKRALIFRTLHKDVAVEVFDQLDAAMQADIIDGLRDEDVQLVFAGMDPDDRADLLDELPATVASRLLEGLSAAERKLTGIVLGYDDGSIGRRMSPEIITLHPTSTVASALDTVESQLDQAESIYTLPVVDTHRKLVGVVSLRDLMRAEHHCSVEELMQAADYGVAHEPAETVARRCADRKRLALPIVDLENRLVGLLTVDDALAILEEAESEDQARMSGSEPLSRPYLATPVVDIVKSRVIWLLVLAVGATLTVRVLESFEDTIAQMVVLSVFVPLLIGTGGNIGNQAATTVTRALALGDVLPRDVFKVLFRELRVGALLGLVLGGLGCGISGLIYGFEIGAVIGLTLLSVCSLAATVGGIMPLIAKALKIDPAVFSNPFITTLVDALGLIIYFLIAKAVLGL